MKAGIITKDLKEDFRQHQAIQMNMKRIIKKPYLPPIAQPEPVSESSRQILKKGEDKLLAISQG